MLLIYHLRKMSDNPQSKYMHYVPTGWKDRGMKMRRCREKPPSASTSAYYAYYATDRGKQTLLFYLNLPWTHVFALFSFALEHHII